MQKSAITIHPDVTAYLREKIAATETLDAAQKVVGLWVEVAKKGCSGNAYDFDVLTQAQLDSFKSLGRFDQPERVEQDGIAVFIEPQSLMKIIGSELYLQRDQFATKLDFRNPNAKGLCGCGESFVLEKPSEIAGH